MVGAVVGASSLLAFFVVAGVSEAVVDPVAPLGSSAHARPVFQPVVTAAPIPRATAKPPTRVANALAGMRYV